MRRRGGNPAHAGTIGIHAVRMGDVVGEHTVHYATTGERVEIRHVATSRDTFRRRALRAAVCRPAEAGAVYDGGCAGAVSGKSKVGKLKVKRGCGAGGNE